MSQFKLINWLDLSYKYSSSQNEINGTINWHTRSYIYLLVQSSIDRSSGWGFWATLKSNWAWKVPILFKTAQPQSLKRFRLFLCQHVYVRLTYRFSEQASWRTQSPVLVNSGSFLHKIWFSNTSPAFVNWCVYYLLTIVVTVLRIGAYAVVILWNFTITRSPRLTKKLYTFTLASAVYWEP